MIINIIQQPVNKHINLLFHDQTTWTSFAFVAKNDESVNISQEYHNMSRPYVTHQKWITKNNLTRSMKVRSRNLREYEYRLMMELLNSDVIYLQEDGKEFEQVIIKNTSMTMNNKQFYVIELDLELM